jgi:hypothetical protein
LNTRLKTRSDYHEFNNRPGEFPALSLNWLLKPVFWVLVGAILGMSYNKKSIDTCYDLLAFTQDEKEAEKATVIAAVEPIAVPEPVAAPQRSQTHAIVRGNASSRV